MSTHHNKNHEHQRKKIVENELHITFSKSSGHGGQNVNKRMTKAEVHWDVQNSSRLYTHQKERLAKIAGSKIQNGVLRITCQDTRYANQNKEHLLHKLKVLFNKSNIIEKKRTATKPTKASRIRHKKGKQQHSQKKSQRSKRIQMHD